MWAHLINMGRHSSYETPPDFPFFRRSKSKSKPATSRSHVDEETTSHSSSSTSQGISPAKRSNLRSQYMSQMREWY